MAPAEESKLAQLQKKTLDQYEASKSEVTKYLANQVEAADNLTGAARRIPQTIWGQVREPITKTTQQIYQIIVNANGEKGTSARSAISSARESLNSKIVSTDKFVNETRNTLQTQLAPVKDSFCFAADKVKYVNDFRTKHPEAAITGLAIAIGLPSLLMRGKWIAARNVVLGTSFGTGTVYGFDKLSEKLPKRK